MDEYIKRNEIIKILEERLKWKDRSLKNATYVEDINEIRSEINELKVIIDIIKEDISIVDVKSVKQGHWIREYLSYGVSRYICSVCKSIIGEDEMYFGHNKFCPVCGAKMDKKDKNNNN